MPPPRRSTRSHVPPRPAPPAGHGDMDRSPGLAPDDLRRTGRWGLLLLTLGCALIGMGLGFLIFPKLLHARPEEKAAQPEHKTEPGDGKSARQPAWIEMDSRSLYPHQNLLPAGRTPAFKTSAEK